ncbi:DNA-binding NarL/FixJ family response regulator [Saonia flava]|uniref:DNA-binding NarL/FixJ family response regulator n=1 Tax=Saonia flava TaxID=523696 RepID=A0A846QMB2_9FLAO|nr:response regulator transcription factor [Saonia flava]NJB70116.1 DNA-binding NarL/FixJ family response regulator [Saonia flava]
MKSNILKIIVIDDDPVSNYRYTEYFEETKNYSLMDIYASVNDALDSYNKIKPDIIVSEVSLPVVSGIAGIQMFKQRDPNVKVVMMSEDSDSKSIKKAFSSGCDGYVSKPLSAERFFHALDSVRLDGAVITNDIAKKVMSMFQQKSYDIFSKRENQIIEHLSKGATYKTIADRLFITTSAVNFHIQNIYLKLNVNSKSEALLKLQEIQ